MAGVKVVVRFVGFTLMAGRLEWRMTFVFDFQIETFTTFWLLFATNRSKCGPFTHSIRVREKKRG